MSFPTWNLILISFTFLFATAQVTTASNSAALARDLSADWQVLSSIITCSNGADVSCVEQLPRFWDIKNGGRVKREFPDGELDVPESISKRAARQSDCQDTLTAYGTAAAAFIGCSVDNSRPILLCEKCVESYLIAQAAFVAYAKTKDENNKSCDDIVYGSDLIEVVHRANRSIESLWGDSHCAYCFDSYYIRYGTVVYSFAQSLIVFDQKHQNLTGCFTDHGVVINTGVAEDMGNITNSSLVCKECYPYYKDLSDFFLKTYTEDITKTCMDVVDVMNQTRRMWGRYFQCEDRHPSMFLPWTVAIIIFASTVVFYIGMLFNSTFEYYVIRRQDRLVTSPFVGINESTSSSSNMSYPPL
ncbi:putative Osteopetrosis-associated transmembrane protein 1 [Hypsibius exemplaris]|uniref:Osteopetrosis-associated transmembrane protein 1 n=1 Tax=Hypsibius exemplaris TaxID=2072580 RepID=A0A1W0WNR1_HYPEX|nr:putative Osteopetrosis-associated transmembrane protein 1 [Hypsibius exemplaris]